MTLERTRLGACLAALAAAALVLATPGLARAAEAEPALTSAAWYWESQRSQPITDPTSGGDVATAEAPNPFCPTFLGLGNPSGQACEEGRLPIEVSGGDYDTPDKMTAVAFDLATIPLGSQIREFTVTFVEADGPQSQPANAEGKELQACPIGEFFGDGEARQYQEAPQFACSDADPRAERKSIKVKGEDRFAFTFDLTALAQQWAAEIPPVTGVMITPVKPEEADFDPATDNNWRTVFAGTQDEDLKERGVQTYLNYKPGEDDFADPFADPGATGGDLGGGGFGTTGDTGGFGEATAGGPIGGEESGEAEPVSGEGTPLAATDQGDPNAGAMPGYAWLAMLAGLIAFSMVRSVVLENAKGIRPDGVLAQIRQINAAQGGGIATAAASRLAPAIEGIKGAAAKLSALTKKLPSIRRG